MLRSRRRETEPRRASERLGVAAGIRVLLALGIGAALSGCAGAQLAEMQRQLDAQKAQIQSQAHLIAQLRAQQQPAGTTLPPPGNCDQGVMRKAIGLGDEQFDAGKFALALGYYRDAATACPGNPHAELAEARAYEKLGDRRQAMSHYQNARDAAGADPTLAAQASAGIARVGGVRQP